MRFHASSSRMAILAALCLPFFLTGCGEGWEAQKVTSFPFGNHRTAGSAIAYVQVKLLPEKPLKIVPVSRDLSPEALKTDIAEPAKAEPEASPLLPVPETPETDDVAEKMDKVFRDAQRK